MNSIKVRVAVAVNLRGDWEAQGSSAYARDDQDRSAVSAIRELHESADDDSPSWLYWIEAEVPVPTKSAIAARIVTNEERATEARGEREGSDGV